MEEVKRKKSMRTTQIHSITHTHICMHEIDMFAIELILFGAPKKHSYSFGKAKKRKKNKKKRRSKHLNMSNHAFNGMKCTYR